MAIRREFGDADKDPGVWHDWREDTDLSKRRTEELGTPTKVMVQACIRGIPQGEENKIKAAHRASTMTVRQPHRGHYSETDLDMEMQRRIARDRASFALVETRNYEVFVGDEEAAKTYSTLLGEIVPAQSNVIVDGRWGKPNSKTRGHILTEDALFTTWVCQVVDGTVESEAKRADELAGNS